MHEGVWMAPLLHGSELFYLEDLPPELEGEVRRQAQNQLIRGMAAILCRPGIPHLQEHVGRVEETENPLAAELEIQRRSVVCLPICKTLLAT